MGLTAHGNETLLRNSDSRIFTNFPGLQLRRLELNSTRCICRFHDLLGVQVFWFFFLFVCVWVCARARAYFISYEWTWPPKASPAHLFTKLALKNWEGSCVMLAWICLQPCALPQEDGILVETVEANLGKHKHHWVPFDQVHKYLMESLICKKLSWV